MLNELRRTTLFYETECHKTFGKNITQSLTLSEIIR